MDPFLVSISWCVHPLWSHLILHEDLIRIGKDWWGLSTATSLGSFRRFNSTRTHRQKPTTLNFYPPQARIPVNKITTTAALGSMASDRIMEKKNVQLRQAAPASDFSIIRFFPIRVQNIPEVIRTFFFFFHNSIFFHIWFFLWNQGLTVFSIIIFSIIIFSIIIFSIINVWGSTCWTCHGSTVQTCFLGGLWKYVYPPVN